METKKVYRYSATDGKFDGEFILDGTDKSPISGAWQIPGNMTEVKPPKEKDGHDRYYVGGKWEYREVPKPETPPAPKEEEPREEEHAPIDEMRVAFAEALAQQESRIAALEATKGGEGK